MTTCQKNSFSYFWKVMCMVQSFLLIFCLKMLKLPGRGTRELLQVLILLLRIQRLTQNLLFSKIWFSYRQSLLICYQVWCLHEQCQELAKHQKLKAFLLKTLTKEVNFLLMHNRICCDEYSKFILLSKIHLLHQTNFWSNLALLIHKQSKNHVCPLLSLTYLKCTWFLDNPFNLLIYSKVYLKSQFQEKQNLYHLSLQTALKQLFLQILYF